MKINVLKNGVLQERQKVVDLEKIVQARDKKIHLLEIEINEKVINSIKTLGECFD